MKIKNEIKIVVDMIAIKSGGGCQLALNFIQKLSLQKEELRTTFLILIPGVGPLSKNLDLKYPNLNFLVCSSDGVFNRFNLEYFQLPKLFKKSNIEKVYTFFGSGLKSPSSVTSIVSMAYPIICYNESPFWNFVSLKYKIKQKLINKIRRNRLLEADVIITETTVMKRRLQDVLRYKGEILVEAPAATTFISQKKRDFNFKNKINFLVLSGLGFHKNLWRLPELAYELKKRKLNFVFNLSCAEADFDRHLEELKVSSKELKKYFLNSRDCFNFCGSIPPEKIQNVYDQNDILLSLSDLESFSNNYMEAWKNGIPLIVSDTDFTRHICGDSALFVKQHDPARAATVIEENINSNIVGFKKRVDNGYKLLDGLPNNEERFNNIIKIIQKITL